MIPYVMALLKEYLSLVIAIPAIILAGGYFSCRLRWLQITHLGQAIKLITPRKKEQGGLSSLSAVAAVLGGNLGTGNVAGVAVALSMGGPGALFWMWVMAILTASLKYAGCFLAVKYRTKNEEGVYQGGPMHYLQRGLKRPLIAKLFCVFTILAALTGGNLVQVNSLALPLKNAGVEPLILGSLMAVLVACTILGGMKRFSTVVSAIVPFMAVGYICSCLLLLVLHSEKVLPAFTLILESAFGFDSFAGGALGCGVFQAMKTGFDRALFATEAGLGLAPILHAPVTSPSHVYPNKVAQGLISVFSPVVVILVVTLTGLVLLMTGVWSDPALESTNQCTEAFRLAFGHPGAGYIVLVTLFFFAFTTLLTWAFCADRAVEFALGKKAVRGFQIFFVCVVPLGSVLSVGFVWWLMDVCLNIMLLLNLVGLIGLRKELFSKTKEILWPHKAT